MPSIKRSTKKQESLRACTVSEAKEEYGYGTRITLEKEELKKLSIKLDDFDVKDTVVFKISAKIIAIKSSDSMHDSSESIEFQITDMYLNPHKGKLLNSKKEY